ncbi:MAG: hypothetical protein A3E56_03165 [Omnitrophica WOR_2 bacterium RIFCSPHIGHO2_12_FULL_64_13]|nr:MAG: hypothetical protein A3E56_03165 [Omnitrophica WOR_2 bacterium RIFCSPHIGHO2_12_FULL_64_13]
MVILVPAVPPGGVAASVEVATADKPETFAAGCGALACGDGAVGGVEGFGVAGGVVGAERPAAANAS